jgi:NAD-dependent dihydropyrimidine dehydrogenase PreA subunit
MSYIIGINCVDVLDRSCIEVCPVDCIYVGQRKSYINASECIDCGACEPECPVEAIMAEGQGRDHPAIREYVADSRAFFTVPLRGRNEPIGNPGGARKIGDIGVDTEFVAGHPASYLQAQQK